MEDGGWGMRMEDGGWRMGREREAGTRGCREDFPVMGDSRLCRVVTLLPLLPFLLLHVVLHQRSTPGDKTVIPRGRVPLLLED